MIRLAVLAILAFAALVVYDAERRSAATPPPRKPAARKTAARRRPTSKSLGARRTLDYHSPAADPASP